MAHIPSIFTYLNMHSPLQAQYNSQKFKFKYLTSSKLPKHVLQAMPICLFISLTPHFLLPWSLSLTIGFDHSTGPQIFYDVTKASPPPFNNTDIASSPLTYSVLSPDSTFLPRLSRYRLTNTWIPKQLRLVCIIVFLNLRVYFTKISKAALYVFNLWTRVWRPYEEWFL